MEKQLFRPEFCRAGLSAPDAAEVVAVLSDALRVAGAVRPSFADAVLAREASSPTGLPFAGPKVAIPHADPEHVLEPAIAVATLAAPVRFFEMGNPQNALDVDLVALLALPHKQSAQNELVALIGRFQHGGFVERLCRAADAEAVCALLRGKGAP